MNGALLNLILKWIQTLIFLEILILNAQNDLKNYLLM